jgi:hypothetical protein
MICAGICSATKIHAQLSKLRHHHAVVHVIAKTHIDVSHKITYSTNELRERIEDWREYGPFPPFPALLVPNVSCWDEASALDCFSLLTTKAREREAASKSPLPTV